MWHQSLINQLIKFLAGAFALSLFSHAFAQSGFYSNFKTLIEIQGNNYKKKIESYKADASLNDLQDLNSLDLDPDFVGSIIFHTPSRYTPLSNIDSCALYDLILSGLAKGPSGEIKEFLVRYKTKDQKLKTALVSKNTFFEKVVFKKCPNVLKFQEYFSLKNVKKTLETLSLKIPKNMNTCYEDHTAHSKDHKTAYLCFLSNQVSSIDELEKKIKLTPKKNYKKLTLLKRELRIAKKYKSHLNPEAVDYLDNLCQNLDRPKLFCEGFFKRNFWKKVAQSKKLVPIIESSCQSLFKKMNLSSSELQACAVKMSRQPQLCFFSGFQDGILTPKPNCKNLGLNLNHSTLNSGYEDCPGKVANDGVVNTARLINHFSDKYSSPSTNCQARTANTFASFNQEVNDARAWNVKLCYDDKLKDSEVCHPVIFGDADGSELSMSKVVRKILGRIKGLGKNQVCRTVSANEYRPSLLEFKNGCFIVVDPKNCSATSCKYKILLDQLEIDEIRQVSDVKFDYLPRDFSTQSFSQAKLLESHFKLTSKQILNTSFLKRSFEKHPEGIMHGVACAEDLLPEFFSKRVINQCTPLPFIVDGYKEDKGKFAVIIRTARDSLHAPRLVPWSNLFSALKDYQRLHPLDYWGLNVLY
tara:strand:+ start:194652 stop:196571 length:1920 start_codon:yes stop_codon:yes gene_type:complete